MSSHGISNHNTLVFYLALWLKVFVCAYVGMFSRLIKFEKIKICLLLPSVFSRVVITAKAFHLSKIFFTHLIVLIVLLFVAASG